MHHQIPIKENNIVKSYKKDENGEVVITRLDENLLQKIVCNTINYISSFIIGISDDI